MVTQQFKKTDLGHLPMDWDVVQTEDILKNSKGAIKIGPFGSQLKKDILVASGKKVYGQENVYNKDFDLGDRYITEAKFNELKSCELRSGDVVISMMGTVGKCTIVPKGIEQGIMDSHLLKLEIDEAKFDKNFLLHLIGESEIIKRQIRKLSVGGIMEGLSSTIVKQLNFPSPPLTEQRKIADILTTVDGQIEQTNQLIEKTKELKKGLMQKLLNRGIGHTKFKKVEFGEIPNEWEVISLGELFKVKSGQGLPANKIVEGNHPVYGGNGINAYHKEYLFEEEKIVIGRVGAKCGCVHLSKSKSWITDNALYISEKTKDFNDKFMFYLLNFLDLNKYANKNAQPVISGQKIYSIFVGMPNVDEQMKIADILSLVDLEIGYYELNKERLSELKKGLMQNLLTGKIRVNV